MNSIRFTWFVAVISAFIINHNLFAASTTFTYQGRLDSGGSPANGMFEMRFAVHDAATNGNPVGIPIVLNPVFVTNGLFTVLLDFGGSAFTGADRWLEIAVTTLNSGQSPITLNPRQMITTTPYALHA